MVAARPLSSEVPPRATRDADGDRSYLDGLTWEQYVAIRDALDERPGGRITFLRGDLEIMSSSRVHENYKTIIARPLERYVVVRGIRAHGLGATTCRNQPRERGLAPDECYCIGDAKDIPDIALEVALSSGGLNKLEVYRGLGVKEVWFWRNERLELFELGPLDAQGLGRYQPIPKSRFLPDLDLAELACASLSSRTRPTPRASGTSTSRLLEGRHAAAIRRGSGLASRGPAAPSRRSRTRRRSARTRRTRRRALRPWRAPRR